MKKLLFLSLASIFAFQVSTAQSLDFGPKIGANFSNFNDAKNFDNKTGFQAGIFLGVKFNDNLAIQPELLYSQQGAKLDKDDFDLDYVTIPVIFKYYILGGLNIQVGPQFGFVVNDSFPPDTEMIGDQIDSKDFDFSGAVGLGLDLPLGFRVSGRYNFGITDAFDGNGKYEGGGKNGVFSVALGFSFL